MLRTYVGGKGSYKDAIDNSLILLAHFPFMRVRMTYNTETVDKIFDSVKHLVELGFKTIAPSMDFTDARWDERHIEILKRQIIDIKTLQAQNPEVKIGLCEKLCYHGTICRGGIMSKHIYYDGKIYPCALACGKEEFAIGSVCKEVDKVKLEHLLLFSKEKNEVCADCDLDGYCSGSRCKIKNKIQTGNFYIPLPSICNYTNMIYKMNGIEG